MKLTNAVTPTVSAASNHVISKSRNNLFNTIVPKIIAKLSLRTTTKM